MIRRQLVPLTLLFVTLLFVSIPHEAESYAPLTNCVPVGSWSGPTNACCCGSKYARWHCDTCAGRYEYYDCGGIVHIQIWCGGL